MPRIKVLTAEELIKLQNGHKRISPDVLETYEGMLKALKKGQTAQVELLTGEDRAIVKRQVKQVADYLGIPIIFRNTRGSLLVFDVREPTAEERQKWSRLGENRRGKKKT